jgi:hypothetical protein
MATFTAGTAAFNMQTAINQINTQITLDDLVSISPEGTNQVWLAGTNYFNLKFNYTAGTGGDFTFDFTRFALLNTANSAGTYKWSMDGSLLSGSFDLNLDTYMMTINVPGLVTGTLNMLAPDPTTLHINAGARFSSVYLRGNDDETGGNANDVLMGGAGHDQLTGGGGGDKFVFDAKAIAGNSDTIADFNRTAGDKIVLDNDIFKALGAPTTSGIGSQFAHSNAMSMTNTVGANVHVLYDDDTGNLYYDPNGGNGTGRVLIATLTHDPALLATDIQVQN